MKRLLLIGLGLLLWVSMAGPLSTYDPEIAIVVVKAPEKRHPYQTEYEEMLYPTVRINTATGTGSGVIFNHEDTKGTKNIYILTAAHVVGEYSEVSIEFYPEVSTSVFRAFVVITDTAKDLALLRINRDCFVPEGTRNDIVKLAKLAPRDYTPYIFTSVWVVGCSLGLKPRPSQGIITQIPPSPFVKGGDEGDFPYWEISAPILPGNSGGPVYDARTFEVIGIAVWVRVYNGQLVTTMAGVVPINQVYEFIEFIELNSKNSINPKN